MASDWHARFLECSIGDLLACEALAPHPVTARERILSKYGGSLSLSGAECPGIATVRDLVASLDRDGRFARCLFITAAHTHWGERQIVESFDCTRDVFLAGPVETAGAVYPISFLFSPEGPIPYEWADHSVHIQDEDLGEIYEFVQALNAAVAARLPFPTALGLMIDHRFKTSPWEEQIFSFAEGPQNEENGRAVIRPVIESVLGGEPRYPDQIQVAWSALRPAVDLTAITAQERAILADLENTLANLSPTEAKAFVRRIDRILAEPN